MLQRAFSLGLLSILLLTGCRAPFFSRADKNSVATAPAPAPVAVAVATNLTNVPSPVSPSSISQLKLPGLFSDNMVLQQGMIVPVWGWAKDGEVVTVNFANQVVSTTAKNGKWQVKLRNLKAGDAGVMIVSAGGNSIPLTNVLVGEVWVCSGQSNMEWPLQQAFQPQADIASATNQMIRLFVVPNTKSDVMLEDVKAKWTICSPETAAPFSAVGYYFGRDLQVARKVPVGLIQSDWGGTPAEAWTSREGLEKDPRTKSEIVEAYPAAEKSYNDALVAYEKERLDAQQKKQEFKKWAPWRPWKPSELYNGMIAPLLPYSIKGVVWYQGESNAGHAVQYRYLFTDMIRDWRHNWGEGDFTFCCVQLAPFKPIQPQPGDSDWAELREAQLLATKSLPKVGMAVITDVGDEHDIHPKKKEPVGARLALAARAIAYGEKIVSSGPLYKSMKIDGDKVFLTFTSVGSGLDAKGSVVKGFAICGEDRKWVWAVADIQDVNTLVVSSPNVPKPIAVRFGWADYPKVNLWNKEGLPASPFRTDDFPLTTIEKK